MTAVALAPELNRALQRVADDQRQRDEADAERDAAESRRRYATMPARPEGHESLSAKSGAARAEEHRAQAALDVAKANRLDAELAELRVTQPHQTERRALRLACYAAHDQQGARAMLEERIAEAQDIPRTEAKQRALPALLKLRRQLVNLCDGIAEPAVDDLRVWVAAELAALDANPEGASALSAPRTKGRARSTT